MDYLAGFEVTLIEGLPKEFSHVKVPAQHYAVFTHLYQVSRIKETVTAIFRDWLPASGCKLAKFPDVLERLKEEFDPHTGTGGIEICIPLQP